MNRWVILSSAKAVSTNARHGLLGAFCRVASLVKPRVDDRRASET
jgi:hypothetical protein